MTVDFPKWPPKVFLQQSFCAVVVISIFLMVPLHSSVELLICRDAIGLHLRTSPHDYIPIWMDFKVFLEKNLQMFVKIPYRHLRVSQQDCE